MHPSDYSIVLHRLCAQRQTADLTYLFGLGFVCTATTVTPTAVCGEDDDADEDGDEEIALDSRVGAGLLSAVPSREVAEGTAVRDDDGDLCELSAFEGRSGLDGVRANGERRSAGSLG